MRSLVYCDICSRQETELTTDSAMKRSRKRKTAETQRNPTKKSKGTAPAKPKAKQAVPRLPELDRAEKLYRKRYDILHCILEAWNTGGIEDMEEIAPDVRRFCRVCSSSFGVEKNLTKSCAFAFVGVSRGRCVFQSRLFG